MPTNETYSKAKRIEDEETPVRKKSNTNTTKKKRKKRKKKKHSYFLWIALIIAMVPCVAVLYILINAMLETGEPINGNRFLNDLNPAITETMEASIIDEISLIEGVEVVNGDITTATLRIRVDMQDELTKEDALAIGQQAVDIVNEHAPLTTYFTSYGIAKMYDLEISVYDALSSEQKPTIHVVYTKNGAHPEVVSQVLTDPVNPTKVAEIEAQRLAAEEAAKQEAENAETNEDETTESSEGE